MRAGVRWTKARRQAQGTAAAGPRVVVAQARGSDYCARLMVRGAS